MDSNYKNIANNLQIPKFCLTCAKYKKHTLFFGILHLFYIFCFIAGLYGVKLYATSIDKVVIQNACGTVQRGHSTSLFCDEVFRETAIRSTLGMLSFNSIESFNNEEKINSILGKSAQKQFQEFLSNFDKKFKELNITQIPKIENIYIQKLPYSKQALCFVEGVLIRSGFYHSIKNTQKLKFTLGLRLARNNSNYEYPYKVLKFIYKEKSIYNETSLKEK
jgi:hypothetical protein